MAGKGAPQGNEYAKKADTGRSISLYLNADDMALLRLVLEQRKEDSSDTACVKLAKMAAKMGINRLLIDKQEEVVYWSQRKVSLSEEIVTGGGVSGRRETPETLARPIKSGLGT